MTMESIFKAAAFAMTGAVLAMTVRKSSGDLGLLLAAAVCLGLLAVVMAVLGPVMSFAQELQKLTGLSSAVTAPLMKTVGIGIVAQTASSVCSDAGEASIAKAVELCGSALAMYAALPLMQAVVELMEELI